ncbi:protein of unknown function [Chitinophaga jiangningensis]|uniref:Protein-glutamine gamma-glutamyltransferase-like C-terminal domain-containing protein n=1 Tax=Chitinophaga jiangningensis TaxID=1419482 RepID=A0A1M7FTW0_9BACT|nr:DUF4129 domain-containing protein [Chitinophaga jiangningensis]SHM07380.1 protein of unknown function [Chitinophaga jiangningensis]
MRKYICSIPALTACLMLLFIHPAAAQQMGTDSTLYEEASADTAFTAGEDSTYYEDDGEVAELSSLSEPTGFPGFYRRDVSAEKLKALREDERLHYSDNKDKDSVSWWTLIVGATLLYITAHIIIFRWVIVGIVLLVLGYLIYRYMRKNGLSFFRKPALVGTVVTPEETEVHSASEYLQKIKAAEASGNIREAIRWWYLYTLFQLAENGLIKPSREKTNKDYLRTLRNTPLYKPFSVLTMDYEYIWYGGFNIAATDFERIQQQFHDFKLQISKQQ